MYQARRPFFRPWDWLPQGTAKGGSLPSGKGIGARETTTSSYQRITVGWQHISGSSFGEVLTPPALHIQPNLAVLASTYIAHRQRAASHRILYRPSQAGKVIPCETVKRIRVRFVRRATFPSRRSADAWMLVIPETDPSTTDRYAKYEELRHACTSYRCHTTAVARS